MENTELDKLILDIDEKVQGIIESPYQIDFVTDCYNNTLVGNYIDGTRRYEYKGKYLTSTAYQIMDRQKRILQECVFLFKKYIKLAEKDVDFKSEREFYFEKVERNLDNAMTFCVSKGYLALAKEFAKIYANKVFESNKGEIFSIEMSIKGIVLGYAKRVIMNGDEYGDYRERVINIINDVKTNVFGEKINKRLTQEELISTYNNAKIRILDNDYSVEKQISKDDLVSVNLGSNV